MNPSPGSPRSCRFPAQASASPLWQRAEDSSSASPVLHPQSLPQSTTGQKRQRTVHLIRRCPYSGLTATQTARQSFPLSYSRHWTHKKNRPYRERQTRKSAPQKTVILPHPLQKKAFHLPLPQSEPRTELTPPASIPQTRRLLPEQPAEPVGRPRES